MLTIVMYHYVRDLAASRFPRLTGLDRARFMGQLDYLARHYVPVTMEAVIAARQGRGDLPPRAVLLTFDDGLIDHHDVVMPLLDRRGWQGSFYPILESVREQRVSAVHKIHHVLAAAADPCRIHAELSAMIAEAGEDLAPLHERFFVANRVGDGPEVNFVKRVLQRGLPEAIRRPILDRLFAAHVTTDEAAFAAELYLNEGHLRALLAAGHHVGNHGTTHRWLAELPEEEARAEIRTANAFLADLGVPAGHRTICYPYGSRSEAVDSIAAAEGCVLGLTTRFDLAGADEPVMALPRLDTNHLPHDGDAPACAWTERLAA